MLCIRKLNHNTHESDKMSAKKIGQQKHIVAMLKRLSEESKEDEAALSDFGVSDRSI